MSKLILVEFDFKFRYGFGKALSVVSKEDLKLIYKFIKEEEGLMLGQIEGKDSKVFVHMKKKHIEVISKDKKEIEVFQDMFGDNYGAYNIPNLVFNYFYKKDSDFIRPSRKVKKSKKMKYFQPLLPGEQNNYGYDREIPFDDED